MTDDAAATSVTSKLDFDPVPSLAFALSIPAHSVAAVVSLLDEGSTVPFIARYRKERTGGLDEVQIREIEYRRAYLVELEQRRVAILESVRSQGKLSADLEQRLRAATTKSELEDVYAPYRPRRRTRAAIARERGLQPLADKIAAQGSEGAPETEAAAHVATPVATPVATIDEALAGARDIVAEHIADTAEVRALVRRELAEHGELVSEVLPGKDAEPTKFEQYYRHREPVKQIPSHRYLAIRRGEAEGVLRAYISLDPAPPSRRNAGHSGAPGAGTDSHSIANLEIGILRLIGFAPESPWGSQLELAARDALKRLLLPSIENELRSELKARSDLAAVEVFAGNLRNLMLAAPLGAAVVIGVDPGLRTGCKCAAVDATGKFLGAVTIHIAHGDVSPAKAEFVAFVAKYAPRAIAIGNGTGGREAQAFVKRALLGTDYKPHIVVVNEAGASVYSASDLAREEFPELDLTIRGAISIARRLQDPLAELVKIEPKSIGVGQYQHDVVEALLAKRLGDVVESCVNHVGVELNTASPQLLAHVAGIGPAVAKHIVEHRDRHGGFRSRAALSDVSGIGPKTFEQSAGFLRIAGADNPLDASAVHPERYPIVDRMAADLGVPLSDLVAHPEVVEKIDLARYVAGDVGEPTLRDIAAELKKPGRDPRAEFDPPTFRDDVTTMEDLSPGMSLEGVVTNVTAFGAFVDIGVHNDGLVHISQLAEQFVKDPTEVVKVGDKLKVRVLEVDHKRKRIALTVRPVPPKQDRPPQQGRPARDRDAQPKGQPGRGQNRRNDDRRRDEASARGGQIARDPSMSSDSRGPRQPEQSGPTDRQARGPRDAAGQRRRDERRNDGPRGPRRDQGADRPSGGRDRAPIDDRGAPPSNWGVSGFVNNPFAALGKDEDPKRR